MEEPVVTMDLTAIGTWHAWNRGKYLPLGVYKVPYRNCPMTPAPTGGMCLVAPASSSSCAVLLCLGVLPLD